MKVVFESEEVALHVLKVILVRLEINVLLLGNLLTEVDLAGRLRKLFLKGVILCLLLIDGGLPRLCLLSIHILYIF